MRDTVGAGGDSGLVRHGGNGTELFRGLSVGHDSAIDSVDTGVVLVVALARLKGAILRLVRDVVRTTNTIEDVLAEVGSIGASRVTSLLAECVATHKAKAQLVKDADEG